MLRLPRIKKEKQKRIFNSFRRYLKSYVNLDFTHKNEEICKIKLKLHIPGSKMILCLRCGEIGTDKQMLLKLANNHFHFCKKIDTIIDVPCSIYVRTSYLRIEKVLEKQNKVRRISFIEI
ncbi:hypothetical protein ES705_15074 [subsurface metagenome]